MGPTAVAGRANVSVVMPCYNGAAYIGEAVRSVLAQTVPVLEILVIDDGSTDESVRIAEGFGPPVRVLRQANAGVAQARNLGLEQARGEWVAFMDADDVWQPVKLERQLAACTGQPDVVCCYTDYVKRYEDLDVPVPSNPVDQPTLGDLLRYFLILPSSALVRREAPTRFPAWAREGEDLIYFAELSGAGRFVRVREPLVAWRQHGSSQTHQPENLVRARTACLRWLEEAPGVSDEMRATITRGIVEDLLTEMENCKWKRDWEQYWVIRRYLAALPAAPRDHPLLQERILPPVFYAVRDWVGRSRAGARS
ncbi:MAG: glycosyltransferase family A protein [Vicinamibacterales bacterium]